MTDQSKVDRANAQFKKAQRAEDGRKALSEYEAEQAAVLAKTERLKALRLARDAAEKAAVAKAPGAQKKAKKDSQNLAKWLAEQRASGRQS